MDAAVAKKTPRNDYMDPAALPSGPIIRLLARVAIQQAKMNLLSPQADKQEESDDER